MSDNVLYYGDNLDILRRHIKDESVDLVYLDPPFKSEQDYNILFAEKNGSESKSQIKAFEDTWIWDEAAVNAYAEVVQHGPEKVSQTLQGFRTFIGPNDMLAYLSMMAPRLVELHRVLKQTGSIYLHCDSTASHYLKILMDAVFGVKNFKNVIIWKRKYGKAGPTNRFGCSTDHLLFYSKTDQFKFKTQYRPSNPAYIEKFFRYRNPDGRRYRIDNLASPNPRPNLMYEYKGYEPPAKGWAISKEKMEQWDREGRLHFPKSKSGRIQRKRYLDELKGEEVQDLWDDILPISSQAKERLGYPTQKPETLLERIITASSEEGDTVLDPFCGCGTTVSVAQGMNRPWVGIDITYLAIALIKHRLEFAYEGKARYKVVGEPVSLPDAEALAKQDPYQFQWWALGLVGARPVQQKKGADKGIDGRLYFHDEANKSKTKQIIFSVKAGKLKPEYVRELRGVVERENAAIGVLISMEESTKAMRSEAADAEFYYSPGWNKRYPKLQLVTVAELLTGKGIKCPPSKHANVTFKKAPKAKVKKDRTKYLPLY